MGMTPYEKEWLWLQKVQRTWSPEYKTFDPAKHPRGEGGRFGEGGTIETVSKTRESVILAEESTIRYQTYETAVIVDDKGDVVIKKVGDTNSVTFTSDEKKLMEGHTLTHTHPSSCSFSSQDILMAQILNLREMRAVSGKYTYSIKPSGDKWPNIFFSALDYQYGQWTSDAYRSLDSELRSEFEEKLSNKIMTIDDANKTHHHELNLRLARRFNLIYTREELSHG